MTNKELAVQIYCSFLQMTGSMYSNPQYARTVQLPTTEDMVNEVDKLTKLLSNVEDK